MKRELTLRAQRVARSRSEVQRVGATTMELGIAGQLRTQRARRSNLTVLVEPKPPAVLPEPRAPRSAYWHRHVRFPGGGWEPIVGGSALRNVDSPGPGH